MSAADRLGAGRVALRGAEAERAQRTAVGATFASLSMASSSQLYTLCGFSAELDWRPLRFVEPVPAHRVCSVCGVLPSVTAFLSCRHVLCRGCYERCLLDGGRGCPIEGDPFLEDDVEWRELPAHNLLSRKVKCWNEKRGCDTVLAAAEINKHYREGCEHHYTSCPKCSTVVLRRDVCGHLRSKCRDHAVSTTIGAPQKSDHDDQKAMMMALNASLDVRGDEIKDRLDQVISDNTSQSDRLNEISHCMNSTKETLQQMSRERKMSESEEFQAVVGLSSSEVIQESLVGHGEKMHQLALTVSNSNKTLREVEYELKQTFRKELQDATRTICRNFEESIAGICDAKRTAEDFESSTMSRQKELALNTIDVNRYEFYVRDIKSMTDSTHSKGFRDCASEKIYICGYHMSPGVYFRKEGDRVLLYAGLQLHKGVIDEFLQWPFNHSVKMTAKHPSEDKHCSFIARTGGNLDYDGRPEESSNEGSYFRDGSFRLDDLEREGYVTDDKLWIVWELVPEYITEEK